MVRTEHICQFHNIARHELDGNIVIELRQPSFAVGTLLAYCQLLAQSILRRFSVPGMPEKN
jgi:hypothetical protein